MTKKYEAYRLDSRTVNQQSFRLMKSSWTLAWILLSSLLALQVGKAKASLAVTPLASELVGTLDSSVSLVCSSSSKPILCLWKTPYGHVYTLSEGVFAESGRLRHKDDSSQDECGLEIVGIQQQDSGQWECEVGSLIGDTFQTATANINLQVKRESPTFHEGQTSRQEVGNDVILHCSADREVHLCRWKTPYLNTYIVGEGIYVERGRIQWLGKDPNYDCTIRVANLDLRDAGTWVCEIGSSTKESFQVQTKEFVIDIETPLKLSAPTALMQNANTDATLVCHANKPYDECLWTTPYGKTYAFPDQTSSHEKGRIAYFGFADTDCGIIVRNVQPRDNGGWQCQLHSRNGDIFQNATDIVSLFAESTSGVIAQPRSIADYDYNLKSTPDYDDYFDGGQFDRVQGDAAQQRPTKIQLIPTPNEKKESTTTRGSTRTRLSDIPATPSGLPPPIELSRITPSTTRLTTSPTSSAAPLSVLGKQDNEPNSSDFAGVNPLELELLSRISGTRRDSRPIRIGAPGRPEQHLINGIVFESTKTTTSQTTTTRTTSPFSESTTSTAVDSMRQLEIQRIRDERRKVALEKQEREQQRLQQEEEAKRKAAEDKEREEQARRQLIVERQRLEERRRKMEEQRRKEMEERKRKEEEEEKARKEEEEKQKKIEEERNRQREEEARQKRLEEERKRKAEEEARRKRIEEERRRKAEEEARQKRLEEERKRKAEEEARQKRLEEERKRKAEEEARQIRIEEERKRKAEEEARQKRLEEERKRKAEEEARRQRIEEERKRKAEEEERQKKLEEERKRKAEEEERKRKEEEERKKKEEEERKRQEEVQRRREEARRQREEELKKQQEEERRRKELEAQREREEEERRKAIEAQKAEQEKKRKEEEEQKRRDAEIRRRLEIERKRKEDEEKRLAEIERQRQEQLQREREELERKRKEEEERLLKEIEKKKKEEEERRKEEAERKRKEEEEIARKFEEARKKEEEEKKRLEELKRQEERRRRIELQRQRDEAERQRKLEAEKQRKEEEERQRRLEEEKAKEEELRKKAEDLKRQREEERRRALERVRQERIKEEQEDAIRAQQEDARRQREEERRKIEEERRQKAEEQQRQFQLSTIQQSNLRQPDLDRASLIPRTESPRSFPASSGLNLPGTELEGANQKRCYVSASVANGNVTCENNVPDIFGEYSISHGDKCELNCKSGYVSVYQKEALCQNGKIRPRLDCVRPDALLLLAGRSDTHGVLNSVELVTKRGVCRGAVPTLPAMRWRMIAESIDKEHVLACGGVNIFGDPKKDCWVLDFESEPVWSTAPDMLVARDAAAWALEGNFLIVMGGSLGKLNGYTDSVEMHNVKTNQWIEGPRMSSSRYSHCAVGLGNGSIIVTGGYGGLEVTERLDIDTGKWWPLPELNPVRAQHGCAIVDLDGEQGVLVVGGDSGGTRLKDVRFLPLNNPSEGWRKVADLNTARWGRPGVAMVGGRITVAAGWDGVRDLDTVEYYDEKTHRWRLTASRLQFERRWPASTPISLSLFPKCAQKRER